MFQVRLFVRLTAKGCKAQDELQCHVLHYCIHPSNWKDFINANFCHPNCKWRSRGVKKLAEGNKTGKSWKQGPQPRSWVLLNILGPRHLPAAQRWNHNFSDAVKVWQLTSVKQKYNPIGLFCLYSNYPNFLRQSVFVNSLNVPEALVFLLSQGIFSSEESPGWAEWCSPPLLWCGLQAVPASQTRQELINSTTFTA